MKEAIRTNKISTKLGILILILLSLPAASYALGTILTGHKTTTTNVTIYGQYNSSGAYDTSNVDDELCYYIRHTGGEEYFIPTKTFSEYSSLVNNEPAEVTLTECPTVWKATSESTGTACGAATCSVSEDDPCPTYGNTCLVQTGADSKTSQCFYDLYRCSYDPS